MRRPLCFLCLIFSAVIVICSRLVPMAVPLPAPDYEGLDRQQLTLEGTVYQKEYRKQTIQKGQAGDYKTDVLIIYLKSIQISDQSNQNQSNQNQSNKYPLSQIQRVVCYMDQDNGQEPALGSTVRVNGKVRCFAGAGNPGEFDARGYYRLLKLDFQLRDAHITASDQRMNGIKEGLYRLRRYFEGVLDSVFEEKEASIMKAMLLGEKSNLHAETKELYRQSSILHILSISGLHISLIGMGIYRLLKRLRIPMHLSVIISVIIIIGYGSMTGMSLSAVRAIFMFTVHLAADMAGRTYDMMTALSLAAVILLMEQPGYTAQSGFLFSFGAVAALCVLEPVLRGEGKESKKWRKLKRAFTGSFAVSAATIPVQLYFYFEFPFYSLFLNMMVIPLMTFVMGAGLFCMLTGGIFYLPAYAVSHIDRLILWFYEQCCIICGKIPWGTYTGGMPEKWQISVYIILLLIFCGIGKRQAAIWKIMWMTAALSILLYHPAPKLQITMLDVGQGDCIHIQSANGRHYLIDGGSSTRGDVAKYQILPYLKAKGIRRLEAVFVTHSDVDHSGGITAMLKEYSENNIMIGTLVLPDIDADSRDDQYRELENLAAEKDIPVQYMSRGQVIKDGDLRLACMHPAAGYATDSSNEYSLALYLSYGNFTALFTGDAESGGERELQQYMKDYMNGGGNNGRKKLTLLKVAHHGSANSTGEEFLKDIPPVLAFISCEKKNQYGHPHKELLERLEEAGTRVYITTENGAVTVEAEGEKCRISTFR